MKNIIFDFGQVLVRFDPIYMTSRYLNADEDIKTVSEILFDRLYWDRLDAGTITDEETLRLVSERLPERLHGSARDIYYNWIYNIPEISGMRELVLYIKEKYGIPVYLLSNISEYFSKSSDKIPVLSLFDGCIFSADYKLTKPSREIFELLCNKFNLVPEETLFIDDSEINTQGAEAVGINTYLFDQNPEKLKENI